ncbi:DeoR/GlpR family DNA-binding transcription regulator [Flavisolibacter ginsenosidimutans]|uniref:DeoR/GlpR transcriptional regulator n=1 Tax=Flavisolibacter ginsenosidimutans TaxID=661481 RepID=A0A5B8UDZ1_9BACT|nr:DeoR/GlpR family DNA-binding transcription regulator [Flavisolibacter ginsenosidimutans]QEC54565.1 DeoR/GlpR transcriptional regulator [Flavisolibacter ginsenosidimutans]
MTITERHQAILKQLQETGRVDIQKLSENLQVTGVTIRKDLKLLEERNLLFRTKGGGSLQNPYASERPINEKEFINVDQKRKIAKAALPLTTQTDSIIIGSGTTVYELSRCLSPTKHLIVITPALKVALELHNRPNVEVLQLGGLIHQSSASAAGTFAELILDHISCDVLFLGADGIDPDFGISITNLNEASLNQKMINVARKVVIMADGSKFGRRGLGRVCNLDTVQSIITDSGAPAESVKALEERGINVVIAD